jgi:trehalose 6-phosphate synthase
MPAGFADLPVVLVSHRGPVSFERNETGRTASRGAGGLVTALTGLASSLPDAVWVCAASSEEDVAVAGEHGDQAVEVTLEVKPRVLGEADPAVGSTSQPGCVKLRLVQLNEQPHDDFYTVIANPLLWFLQHGMYGLAHAPRLTRREHTAFEDGYLAVNQAFADAVVEEVQDRGGRALVMLHDYHFYLVGQRVRERCPGAVVSFFLPAHPLAGARTPGGCCPRPGASSCSPGCSATTWSPSTPKASPGTSCCASRSCWGCRSTWRR